MNPGMGTPNLYSPNTSFPFETQPKPRAFLLSFLRLRRPTLLQPFSTSSDLALPSPSPAYLFEQELRFFDDALQLAQMILFVLRRMERTASRERWYASYAAAERAEGYPLTAWTSVGKEGEEKRLLSVVGQMGLEVGAWSLEIGQGMAEWCMLVGWWVLSPDAGGGVEEVMRSWEEKGRKLEHLVLASVRDESTRSKLPTRLLPLIEGYPYAPASSFGSAGHSRSSSQLSLTLPTGGPLSNLPGDPSTSNTKRILHVSISPPSGKKGLLREGFRVDPERLAGWAVGANEDTERGLLAAQVWKELLSSARSTSLTDNTIAKDVHLDDLFSDKTLDLIRFISSLFPSTPPIPIAQEPKEEKPIYRPFPKSTSSFLDREGLVESADENVLLGPVIHDGQSTIRPGHRRQRSKSHSVGTTVPKSFLSETTTVDVFGGSGVEISKTADSTWADFSSFGFDTPSSSSTPHLALGSGLEIDPSKGGKGLNAKERELERLLRGDFGDETKVVSVRGGSNVDLALQGQTETKETGRKEEEARAELKSVSILCVPPLLRLLETPLTSRAFLPSAASQENRLDFLRLHPLPPPRPSLSSCDFPYFCRLRAQAVPPHLDHLSRMAPRLHRRHTPSQSGATYHLKRSGGVRSTAREERSTNFGPGIHLPQTVHAQAALLNIDVHLALSYGRFSPSWTTGRASSFVPGGVRVWKGRARRVDDQSEVESVWVFEHGFVRG